MKSNVRSYRSLLLSSAVAVVVIGVSVFAPHAAEASNSDLGASISGVATAGNSLVVVSAFKNIGSSGNYVLDTEIYSANNIQVAQFAETIWLNSNDSISKTYQWNTASLAAGNYRISQGLFYAGWSGLVEWRTSAGTVNLAAPKPWALTASANALSTTVNIQSSFVAPVTGQYLLDTEVYDSSNNRVAQWPNTQTINGGATASLAYNWSAQTGVSYSVRQGVFTPNWAQLLAWSDHSATFKLASVTTTTLAPPTATTTGPVTVSSSAAAPAPATTKVATASANPLSGLSFYGTNAGAAAQASAWQTSRPQDAALMTKLASVPSATWMGEWSGDITAAAKTAVNAASVAGKTAVLVAYNIPQRDCGGYSGGGQTTVGGYNAWVAGMANGIKGHNAVVILEPDALGVQSCLNSSELSDRYAMLSNAVHVLHAAGALVYIDASYWVDANTMATQLQRANIAEANGFALNTSNFNSTSAMNNYGNLVSAATGGKHFVVDTSRNGNGGNGQWCNPSGQSLGQMPTASTGIANADAYLWLKTPGESDGTCNGGPSAGTFWADYALGLARSAWS